MRGHRTAVTDREGRATVPWDQGDGVAGVTAVAPGRTAEFAIYRGRAPDGLELTLRTRNLVRVTGVVRDDAGVPVARATVREDDDPSARSAGAAIAIATLGAGQESRSRADGRFSIVVAEGDVRLFAAKAGYCASGVASVRAPAQDVTLVVTRTFTMVAKVVNERGLAIRGPIRVEHGHPDLHPADELPREWSDPPDTVTRVVRSRDGLVRVAGLRPGTSAVRLRHGASRRATIEVGGSPGDVVDVGVVTLAAAGP